MDLGTTSDDPGGFPPPERTATWTIHVDPEQSLAEITAWDSANLERVRTIAQALVQHPDWQPDFDVVWELTGLGSVVVAPEDVPGLLQIRDDFGIGTGRSAIVVRQEDHYALAQLLVAKQQRATGRENRVFRSRKAAYAWLGRRPLAP